MCGIFGHIHPAPLDPRPILQALQNRGPDDQHIARFNLRSFPSSLTLYHTRLSIIDLSSNGRQPMSSTCGRYTIVYNGEIYNYVELKQQLLELGYNFHSHSDTEVLLTAYRRWGKECLQHLNGIFAFAIWDQEQEELFFARDPFGVKPFYYLHQGNTFAFSSEVSALLQSGLISQARLSPEGLQSYLQFGYSAAPYTIIKDIFALLPAHWGIWKAGKLQQQRYWNLQPQSSLIAQNYEEAKSLVRHSLQRAVELQMRADVDVGLFLSGGIDSGLLLALAHEHTSRPLNTFSVGFNHEGHHLDETHLGAISARKYGSHHHHIVISQQDFAQQLPDFIQALDVPSGDGLNSYFVARATGKSIKVVLSGLGGDEVFGGYPAFHDAYKASQHPLLSSFLRKLPLSQIFTRPMGRKVLQKLHLNHLGFMASEKYILSYRSSTALWDESRSINQQFLPQWDYLQKVSFFEIFGYMSNMLLRDVDAVSMHHSLEVRVPFLDIKLVELAFSLPASYKMRMNAPYNKPLLVESFPHKLPAEILQAPKRGFQMPIGAWLRDTFNQQQLQSLPQRLQNFGIEALSSQKIIERFYQRPKNYMELWKLIVLDLWIQKNLHP